MVAMFDGVWPPWDDHDEERSELYSALNDMPVSDLLALERKLKHWTVKEQAAAIGLERSDLYKAAKVELPLTGLKQARLAHYIVDLPVELAKSCPTRYLTAAIEYARTATPLDNL